MLFHGAKKGGKNQESGQSAHKPLVEIANMEKKGDISKEPEHKCLKEGRSQMINQ